MTDDLTPNTGSADEQPFVEPSAVNKARAALNTVEGDVVQINQSSINQVNGDTVKVQGSSVRHIAGQSISAANSIVMMAQGNNINVSNGGVGICSVANATVNGNLGVMVGQSVTLNDHRTGLIISRDVHGGPIQSVFFIAGQTHAPVETIVDQRSVALFGAAAGVALGLVLGIFRLLKR
jgi:repressor of nif and glnA expression